MQILGDGSVMKLRILNGCAKCGIRQPPSNLGISDTWPSYVGSFIHLHADVGDEAVPEREALSGLFGLFRTDHRTRRSSSETTMAEARRFRTSQAFGTRGAESGHDPVMTTTSSARLAVVNAWIRNLTPFSAKPRLAAHCANWDGVHRAVCLR